ncbi:dTDP-glucose 4,6-dehydratase [Thermosipho africanus H17ap60334]|uniref:dTDP-glucose 4,6-dehydratase n=1 Tax=Thermosipho africanus (strain TCF52B) TaxID=484019 RepID=B7IGW3_THEAB|nr:dTDP-glucose 4,6-dehydratase [Thermosipho africanus]ACJ75327.1 dTDP-glucose 4,6-dehydratase [Thermosipho africanus TCF52B]EKF48516.1 dTDP-glucose 4,6-dehydratase [Thermosipho africanus H17ap60334]RDI90835.1 dTDP-glucose 4,6-dehydratase [Thermosipho africanus Ob7]
MKLLVTGCCGFIGSNFVYYYLEKHKEAQIIGLDKLTYAGNLDNLSKLSDDQKKRFEFVRGDINNGELIEYLIEKYDIDVIVNFAAESHVDRSIYNPREFLETNVLGVQTLLDVVRKKWNKNGKWIEGKKFIQISTDEVYGTLGPSGKFTEKTPISPRSPYSASKASADLLVLAYHETYGMPVNITRCSNNYGPYQFPEKLIPLMILNALEHKNLPIYGDGRQIRDWIHVLDHCRAIDLVIEKGKVGEVYNVGADNEWENIKIVRKIIEILREFTKDEEINENLIKHVKDRPGHDRRYAIDSTKIQHELGWKPEITFEKGLRDTIKWYLDNKEWIEKIRSGEYRDWYEKHYVSEKKI